MSKTLDLTSFAKQLSFMVMPKAVLSTNIHLLYGERQVCVSYDFYINVCEFILQTHFFLSADACKYVSSFGWFLAVFTMLPLIYVWSKRDLLYYLINHLEQVCLFYKKFDIIILLFLYGSVFAHLNE